VQLSGFSKVFRVGGIFTYSPAILGINPWKQFEFSFTATGTQTTLVFESLADAFYNGPVLDNVITASPDSPIPEPGSYALGPCGVMMLLSVFRVFRN
jgi:hypothetical protein